MDSIGERIVFMRDEREISQKDLAAKLHVTAATLSRYENNQYAPKVEILCDICNILQTTPDFLLGFTRSFEMQDSKTNSPITPQEAHFLKYYRLLNKTNQVRIMERMDTLLDIQSRQKR